MKKMTREEFIKEFKVKDNKEEVEALKFFLDKRLEERALEFYVEREINIDGPFWTTVYPTGMMIIDILEKEYPYLRVSAEPCTEINSYGDPIIIGYHVKLYLRN